MRGTTRGVVVRAKRSDAWSVVVEWGVGLLWNLEHERLVY